MADVLLVMWICLEVLVILALAISGVALTALTATTQKDRKEMGSERAASGVSYVAAACMLYAAATVAAHVIRLITQ